MDSVWESPGSGRPPRHLYRLTGAGLSEAAKAGRAPTRAPRGHVLACQHEAYAGTISSGLTAVGDVLVGQPLREVNAFRHALIDVLGAGVARARGPYGQKPTTEASQMLMMLDEFLRPGINFASDPVGDAASGQLRGRRAPGLRFWADT